MKKPRMGLNLIAEPIANSQLPYSIQHASTYCNLEPDSRRIKGGLSNVLTKKTTILAKAVICQMQLANIVPKLYAPVDRCQWEQTKKGMDP